MLTFYPDVFHAKCLLQFVSCVDTLCKMFKLFLKKTIPSISYGEALTLPQFEADTWNIMRK